MRKFELRPDALYLANQDTIKTVKRLESQDSSPDQAPDFDAHLEYLKVKSLDSQYSGKMNMFANKNSAIFANSANYSRAPGSRQANNVEPKPPIKVGKLPNQSAKKDEVKYHILKNSKNVFGVSKGKMPPISRDYSSSQLSPRRNPNQLYKEQLKEKADRLKYTTAELRSQKRLKKQAFKREAYQSESDVSTQFKDIECRGIKTELTSKKDSLASRSLNKMPNFVEKKKTRGMDDYDENGYMSLKSNKEPQQINVDSINQKVESYEIARDPMEEVEGLLNEKRHSNDSQEYSQMKPKIQGSDKARSKKYKKNKEYHDGAGDQEPGPVHVVPFDRVLSGHSIRDLEVRRVNTLSQLEPDNPMQSIERSEYKNGKAQIEQGPNLGSMPNTLDIKVESTPNGIHSLSTVGYGSKVTNTQSNSDNRVPDQISIINQNRTPSQSFLRFQKINNLLDKINDALENRGKSVQKEREITPQQLAGNRRDKLTMRAGGLTGQSLDLQAKRQELRSDLIEHTTMPQEIFSQAPYSQSQEAYGMEPNVDLSSQYLVPSQVLDLTEQNKILQNSMSYQKIMKAIPRFSRPKTNSLQLRQLIQPEQQQQYQSLATSQFNSSCLSQQRMQLRHKNSVSALTKISNKDKKPREGAQSALHVDQVQFYHNAYQSQEVENKGATWQLPYAGKMGLTYDQSQTIHTRPGTSAVSAGLQGGIQAQSQGELRELPYRQNRSSVKASQSFKIRNISLGARPQIRPPTQPQQVGQQHHDMSNEAATVSSVLQTYQSRTGISPQRSPEKLSLNLSALNQHRGKQERIKAQKTQQMFWECVEKSKKIAHHKASQMKNEPQTSAPEISEGTGTTNFNATGKTQTTIGRSRSQNLKNVISKTLKQFGQTENQVIQKWANPTGELQPMGLPAPAPGTTKEKPGPAAGRNRRTKLLTEIDKRLVEKTKATIMKRLSKRLLNAMCKKTLKAKKLQQDMEELQKKQGPISKELQERILQELEKHADFHIPDADDKVCEELQYYQQSTFLDQMNDRAKEILDRCAAHEIEQAKEDEGGDDVAKSAAVNIQDLLKNQRLLFKSLHHNINNILVEGGNQAKIKLSCEPYEKAEVFVFDKNVYTYAKVDFKGKNLPVTFKFYHQLKDKDEHTCSRKEHTYHDTLPEDLKVYISMNDNEPGPKNCELVVDNFAAMNEKKQSGVTFGSQATRKHKKYPDRINLCFVTSRQGCVLDVKCQFQRSEEEVIESKKQKIMENKANDKGVTAALELLTPRARRDKIRKINEDLDAYYEKNVKEEDIRMARQKLFAELKPNAVEKSLLQMRSSMRMKEAVEEKLKITAKMSSGPSRQESMRQLSLRQRRSLSNTIQINVQQVCEETQSSDSESVTDLNEISAGLSINKLQNLDIGNTNVLGSPLLRQSLYPRRSDLRSEEQLLSVSLVQTMLKQRQDQEQFKMQMIKMRRMKQEINHRKLRRESLSKWNHFREERKKYADFVEKLLKDRIRLRFLITLIKQLSLMAQLHRIYEVKKEENLQKMNNMFLAIKFYVKFKVAFRYKFGREQDFRYQNHLRRGMAFRAMLTNKSNIRTSQKIVGPAINGWALGKIFQEQVLKHQKYLLQLQENFRILMERANSYNRGMVLFLLNREFTDLKAVIGRQNQKPALKAFKQFKTQQESLTENKDETFAVIGKEYLTKCYLEHGLRYMVFRYLTTAQQLEKIEAIDDITDFEDAMETRGKKCKATMKQLRADLEVQLSKIIEIESNIYQNSDIVEIETTYHMTGEEPKKVGKGQGKKKKKQQEVPQEQQVSAVEQVFLKLQKDSKKQKEYLKTHENRDAHTFDHCNLRDDVARAIMAEETDLVSRYKVNLDALGLLVSEDVYKDQKKQKQVKLRERLGIPSPVQSEDEDYNMEIKKKKKKEAGGIVSFVFPAFAPTLYIEEIHRLIFHCISKVAGGAN